MKLRWNQKILEIKSENQRDKHLNPQKNPTQQSGRSCPIQFRKRLHYFVNQIFIKPVLLYKIKAIIENNFPGKERIFALVEHSSFKRTSNRNNQKLHPSTCYQCALFIEVDILLFQKFEYLNWKEIQKKGDSNKVLST